MQIIKRNVPKAGYEQFDSITTVPDEHVFSEVEQGTDYIIETGITMTNEDVRLLLMPDEGISNRVAFSGIPTFRNLAVSNGNTKILHRRKYQNSGNTLVSKQNAQDKT